MRHIRRLAIVNRGEAAIRALTAVTELNAAGDQPPMTTVLVHTETEAGAWYVREADEALSLGSPTYVDTADGRRKSRYLDEDGIIAALRGKQVDAVWVGWGFLAESASFAQRCEEAGIRYVGPSSAAIRRLGDKVAAKRLAEDLGLPVVPWSGGPVVDMRHAMRLAAELRYPIVIKAAAGGGGRGIRAVRDPDELGEAFQAARAEAALAFGDAAVFIERQVPAARHVEVQVIADAYGTTWALGVRDCSIQRRHQKVIEESASTVLDAAVEQAIRKAAVTLVSAAGYHNAGTVEFLVSPGEMTFMFMEVNTRLQVEHPVTELTTGVDLVKLQLHVAAGGRLPGLPPPARGHAIEARLCAEDPERGFEPAPGRVAMLALPTGAGIRVDTGVREGDEISAEFDSMMAKIIAWGNDRDEAAARLRRALGQLRVVVTGGTSNQSFLLRVLGHPDFRRGVADIEWLDRLTADAVHMPASDPVALLQAAVEAFDTDWAAEREAFHSRAARGNPEPPPVVGREIRLCYRGANFPLRVYRTGPSSYRVDHEGMCADIVVDRVNAYERDIVAGGRRHRVVAVTAGPVIRVEVDGVAHRIRRDDDGAVRAEWPGVIVGVRAAPGTAVAKGDPLVVLESMKMETVLTAPYGGEVTAVEVTAGDQVEVGTPLLRLVRDREADAAGTFAVDLTGLAVPQGGDVLSAERVYPVLLGHLLGYDFDPAAVGAAMAGLERCADGRPPDDRGLLEYEDRLLDLFGDAALLYRRRAWHDPDTGHVASGPRAFLLAYLRWLDPNRAELPDWYREHLARALRRYGVPCLDPSPELAEAVVRLFRSVRRIGEFAPAVLAILQRRMRHRRALGCLAVPALGTRLDRLAAASQGWYQEVADLARAVRFRYLEEPLAEAARGTRCAELASQFGLPCADPDKEGWLADARDLLPARPDLHAVLLRRLATGRAGTAHAAGAVLLEVLARGFYPGCDLREDGIGHEGQLIRTGSHESETGPAELMIAALPLSDLRELGGVVAGLLIAADPAREVVLELHAWQHDALSSADEAAARLANLLAGQPFGHPIVQINVSLASLAESPDGPSAMHQLTFRPRDDGRLAEDLLYRGLHPVLAQRMGLWHLAKFRLQRLPSASGVYLFHGLDAENPDDHRLFALAEVDDLTPDGDSPGTIRYPWLEWMSLTAANAIREVLAAMPGPARPAINQIALSIRPPWNISPRQWPDVARRLEPLVAAAGVDRLILWVRVADPDGGLSESALHVEGIGRGRRAPSPREIIRLLAPPPGAVSSFPPGSFTEYDLDPDGALIPVRRECGRNSANVIVGLLTNYTAKIPEGMTRVVILSDPARGLGNVAEPECRRILAALDLARRMRVPVDWFAVSSGARIAMDSGTENMDWTAAVLRGLVEFTQAGGAVNVVVTGINVGAQAYWNAEATMLMHTRGVLIMVPGTAMVLTGKQSLDYSGGVSAEDNIGIGGFDRVMGPNGQAQYWAPTLEEACQVLLDHHDYTFVVPGERNPRRSSTKDAANRDIRESPHPPLAGSDFTTVGDIFCAERNPERKKPFDIRAVLQAVTDTDSRPLERWAFWHGASGVVVWDARIGGIPVCLAGLESQSTQRGGFVPADGPASWTSGTLFPQSSRKLARAINAASGNRPFVMLANLAGFDGSPESMRGWQLEYGAEIGRAVTNFRGPIVFVVITRYHGGAFVVFSKRLNDRMEIAAIEGSFASVIGGAPAAATVFARMVSARTAADPRVRQSGGMPDQPAEISAMVRAEKLGEVAREFDRVHSIHRARAVGSLDRIIAASELRPYLIDAIERGLSRAADGHMPGRRAGCDQDQMDQDQTEPLALMELD